MLDLDDSIPNQISQDRNMMNWFGLWRIHSKQIVSQLWQKISSIRCSLIYLFRALLSPLPFSFAFALTFFAFFEYLVLSTPEKKTIKSSCSKDQQSSRAQPSSHSFFPLMHLPLLMHSFHEWLSTMWSKKGEFVFVICVNKMLGQGAGSLTTGASSRLII